MDKLCFTVTVFATVGFGEIVATSQTVRGMVTVQMILDLVVIGAVVKVFFGAVQIARGQSSPDAPVVPRVGESKTPDVPASPDRSVPPGPTS